MRNGTRFVAVAIMVLACASAAHAVVIETVTVGGPGNPGELSGEGAGGWGPDRICGAVDYVYKMGKYEVTAGQYAEFLNAVATSDTYGLYNTYMWSSEYGCKIWRTGSPPNYSYGVAAEWADRPVNWISWGDAARFANWLHNGQPSGPQGMSTTEDGSYYLNGAMTNEQIMAVVREPDATWVIPSEDEWYKAAYHLNDGVTGNYCDYPTQSNTAPTAEPPPGTDMTNGSANYNDAGDPTHHRTEVGAYTYKPSDSAYGTYDQAGNVSEWNEAVVYSWARGLRGGSFLADDVPPHASSRGWSSPWIDPAWTAYCFGFRVAEVAEPDCNGNGVPDESDISGGTSEDCNDNGIPDECEIDERSAAPGGPFFCDPAAPPEGLDECDPDCNDTGIPDECELADNDCNSDGRPDECGVVDDCLFDFMTFPTALNTNAASDAGSDQWPQLTTDGQGNWLAVWWSSDSLGGTIGTDFDILFSGSTDNGTTWTTPAPLNTNAASDSGGDYVPELTTDGQGNWLAVWTSDDDLGGTIGTEFDILISASTDNGASWTAPVPLNTNAASDTGDDFWSQLTTDGQGNWLAVWYSDDDLGGTIGTDWDILFSASTDNGASWTAPAPLNTNAASDTGDDSTPQLTTDGQGNWVAVWSSDDDLGGTIGTDDDILLSRSTDNGASWTAPAPLNSNAASDTGDDALPQLTTDGQGNWLAVWESDDDLGGTIGTDYDILYSASMDIGASWTAPAWLNTNAASDTGDDSWPQLTTDGQGNWLALWSSEDDLDGTIGTDYDILYSASRDIGASWTAPAPLSTNAASDTGDDGNPQLTTDGQGNWLAVWHSEDDLGGTIGTDLDILFSQFRSVGEDCNCNGTADACDIADCTGDPACDDCNGNGIPDQCDIDDCAADPACDDCNGNGIPDQCDIADCAGDPACDDCNSNGVPDWCDIDDGAQDNNGNGVPDECEDCNGNGVQDSDDIANLTSPDCNSNWFPDECEIDERSAAPGGPFFCDRFAPPEGLDECDPDCNDTGIPDECELTDNDCNSDGRPDECGVVDDCLLDFMTFPAALNTNAAFDSGLDAWPAIATDGQGNWVAVWFSSDDLGGTIGTDWDILFARSTDNGASWTYPKLLNTNGASDSERDDSPQLTTDGQGNWVAVWRTLNNLAGNSDIHVARSTNNGVDWTYPEEISDARYSHSPQLSTDGQGNWVAVWGYFRHSDPAWMDILVARSTDNGEHWTNPEILNGNSASQALNQNPHLATDALGNWVAVWASRDDLGGTIGTDLDIFVARSTDNGATWTYPEPLPNAASDEAWDDWDYYPHLTTDGQGNWLAVWESEDDLDGTIGGDYDILAARSTNNGVDWTYPEPLNANAASDTGRDSYAQLTTDGQGNWLAAWMSWDDLGGTIGWDTDVLRSTSTDNGETWTYPAPLNTNAASDSGADWAPQTTTDAQGNWVAVWYSRDDLGGTIGNDADILFSQFRSVGEDCNCNATADTCDIAEGTSADLNTNGIPDECEAGLDIKPGSCPNPLNRGSHGVLPAALLGTAYFDATTIDVTSVRLARADGIGGDVAPHEGPPGPQSVFEDVGTPFDGEPCDCHELEGDGIIDLMMHFKTDDVVANLLLDDLDAGALVELVVTGELLDGTEFAASDCVRLVPPGTAPGLLTIESNVPGVWVDADPLDETLDGGGFADFQRVYPLTTVVTLRAQERMGHLRLAGWLVDGVLQTRDSALYLTITEDVSTATVVYQPATSDHASPTESIGSIAP